MNKGNVNLKKYIYSFVIIIGFIGLFIYLKNSGILNYMTSAKEFEKYITGFGNKAYILFFILQFISVVLAPIPSNISAVVGGSVFGLWSSFFISMLAIVSGSIIIIIIVRSLGRSFVERFINPKFITKYEQYFTSRRGELLLIILLLLPFFPDDTIGIVAGLSKISLKRYVILMLFTRPWEILAASAMGSANIAIPLWAWGFIGCIIIILAMNSNKLENKLVAIMKAT